MLTTAYVNISSFFYPIGNTTAICLTQDLSPEQPAKILLLGCGDARNILFTSYSEDPESNRTIDITCCDVQSAVIARNIILFTLLIDDTSAANINAVWDLYYHFYLDHTINLLHNQSQKLCNIAISMQSWEASVYGKTLRFCDERSLDAVRKVWKFYNKTSQPGSEKEAFDKKFKEDIQQSLGWKQRILGTDTVGTGIRSAAPAGMHAVVELPAFHKHYWKHGITEESTHKIIDAKFANPMFATTDASVLHYGTDPLLGFHLATSYLPLTTHSPLRPENDKSATQCKAVHAARVQFAAWTAAFRKLAQKLTIRFVVSDALAFCHTLQHKTIAEEGERANLYANQYSVSPLILEGKEYDGNGKAPRIFNLIDTSNLADHVGFINLLVATKPLLENNPWSTIYTELLVKQEEGPKELTESLLCSHFTTMSCLLGLFPVEFFSNASAISNVDQSIMEHVLGKNTKVPGQQLRRLVWKRSFSYASIPEPLHFDEDDLARIFHRVYKAMFQHEDMSRLMSRTRNGLITSSLIYYHRGSFASLLRYVKNSSKVKWDKMMALLLNLIEQDTTSILNAHHFQELYAHLHLMGLHTPEFFDTTLSLKSTSRNLGAWKEIPPVVSITLEVPRANLKVLTSIPVHQLSTPLVQCVIQAPPTSSTGQWHNIFCALQLSFGKVSPSGSRDSNDFKINIVEDHLNWKGNSSLLVSFYVPSAAILLEPSSAKISFGFQTNPHTLGLLMGKLGMELKLFETVLGDREHVFITRYLPNQGGYPSICRHVPGNNESTVREEKPVRTTVTAHISHSSGRVTAFTGRIDLESQALKTALADKAVVMTHQSSPRTIEIAIGESGSKHLLHYPLPVLNSRVKIRVARKSSFIEVIVPLGDHAEGTGFPNYMYPISVTGAEPVVWNLPFLRLDSLPAINASEKLQWLNHHVFLQMSARERQSREFDLANPAFKQKDVRINFKDTLYSMFITFTGLQTRQRTRVMGLHHPESGVNILIFVSELRLDLGNQTAVLDAAILPLRHDLIPRMNRFMSAFAKFPKNLINVDDDELCLWKEVLPAYVERCRTFKHLPNCLYNVKSRIPLSTDYAEPFLCSCGNGTVPANFMKDVPHFDTICKYMVRAAISPSYAVPFVEPMISIGDEKSKLQSQQAQEPEVDKCATCGRTQHMKGGKLSVCSKCHGVKYCSVECQKADWKMHKKSCAKDSTTKKVEGGDGGNGDQDLNSLMEALEAEGLD